jgi:transcriptional regulator with XRE-family HTH domain
LTKIEKIFSYLEKQGVSVSEFERKSGLGNSYLSKTKERGSDITTKIEERIRQNNPTDYHKIFDTGTIVETKKPSPGLEEGLKDELIASLKDQVSLLKDSLKEKEILLQEVLKRLDEISEGQQTVAAAQQAWQEFWTEHIPLKQKMTLIEIKGIIRNKAFDKQQIFQKEGIQIS